MLNLNNNISESIIQTIVSEKSIDYIKAVKFMEKRVDQIISNKNSELIWLLYHPNIYTVGKNSKSSDFLKKPEIPVHKTNRGGQITYHGPGQRIAYFMINLNNRKRDVRYFVNILEKIMIDTLKEFNVIAKSRNDRIGIWVTKCRNKSLSREKKIGSIGVRIKKWVTYHGISININPNLDYFNFINPCGIKNYPITSLKELGVVSKISDFDEVLIEKSNKFFKY